MENSHDRYCQSFSAIEKRKTTVKVVLEIAIHYIFLTLTSLSGIPAFSHTRPYPHCVMHPDGEPFDCIDILENSYEKMQEHVNDPARNSQLGVRSHTVTYKMRNNTREVMLVRFFDGQDVLYGSSYRIEPFSGINNLYVYCSTPSTIKICVGASNFDDSKTWGVGFYNSNYCSDCCFHCFTGERGVVDFNP